MEVIEVITTIAEPVPDLAISTGSSIVLLDDALASPGWLQGVFSLECRASSVPVSLFARCTSALD